METTIKKEWNEGARLRFYLNGSNHRGWGVVYLFCQLGEKRVRLSCGVKSRLDYWSKGGVKIPFNASMTDKLLHQRVGNVMEEVKKFVDEKTFDYLCGSAIDIESELKQYTAKLMGKKTNKVRLIKQLQDIVNDVTLYPNPKTQNSIMGYIGTFREFLTAKGIDDDLNNYNTETLRAFRDWLVNETDKKASSAKVVLTYIAKTLCERLMQKGFKIDINLKAIAPIKDNRTKEQKEHDGKVALTYDEIERLRVLELTGTKKLVRDLFLLQCWGGCRFEDLTLFLSSDNIIERDGVIMKKYTPQKTNQHGNTARPLLNVYYQPYLWKLWNEYKDRHITIIRNTYNNNLKKIAEQCGLDRKILSTEQNKSKHNETFVKLYEVLSSHDGRHTFSTNMQRYEGKTPEQVIIYTGHSTSRTLSEHYFQFSNDDKDNKAFEIGTNPKGNEYKPNKPNQPNFSIDGMEEAKSVMRYLGIEFNDDVTFDEALSKIGVRQWDIIEKYGVSVEVMKSIFNLSSPMAKRVQGLGSLLEAFK